MPAAPGVKSSGPWGDHRQRSVPIEGFLGYAHIETSQAEVRKITLHQVFLARQAVAG